MAVTALRPVGCVLDGRLVRDASHGTVLCFGVGHEFLIQ
jgi:hypothetical protein